MVTCRFKTMNSNQSDYQATFTWKCSFKKSLCLTIATFVYLKLDRITSETHPLLLCGISSIWIFEIRNWLVLLKNKSSNCTKLYQKTIHAKSYLVCLMSALNKLRFVACNLCVHKLRHNFQGSHGPFCNWNLHNETMVHLFLHSSK